jgi:hypothetical protein
MKKTFVFLGILSLVSVVCSQSSPVGNKLKSINSNEYKGWNQVTVFDSTEVKMEASGLSYINNHKLIKVLNHNGAKENSVFKIDYDPQSAYVEIEKVIIHRANGATEALDLTKKVCDYVAPARMIYWGASQKMVEIGMLNPGDAIEVWTFKKGFTYALLQQNDDSKYIPPMKGHFYDIVPFWADQPVKEKVYILSVLKEKNLQYKVYNGEVASSVSYDGDRSIYSFNKKDIMPLKREPNMVANNDVQTKLLLSTSPNWEAKSMWFYNVNEEYGSFKSYPELDKMVKNLLKPAKTELDSISILTHWVADNMRYSGISMGEGEGYTLHNARMNFTDRCGVCKDKASLLIAMLRAAGFESYAAMTMAGERIDRIPADQFNHSVTVVKRKNGKFELLDPTWVPNVRELWSSAEQQQGYLMGLPKGADLMETPVSAPENHYIKINGKSEIAKDGTLTGEFTIEAEGQSDAGVRGVFSARYSEWQRNVEMELLKIDPRAQLVSVKYTNPEEYLKQPVKITYKYKIPNYAVVTDKEIIFTPVCAKGVFTRAMNHLRINTSLENRNYPFKDRCSRLLEVKEEIKLPKGYTRAHLPKKEKVNSEFITFESGYHYKFLETTLTFEQKASFGKRVYEANEWTPFKEAVDAQKKFSNEKVVITVDSNN